MNNLIGYYDPKRFTRLPDGWIRDWREEREHGPSSPTPLGPEERKKFCENMGGQEPEADEAASIVNYEGKDGFFEVFSDTRTDNSYATKTEVAWSKSRVRVVSYGRGNVNYSNKDCRYYVRPVRPMPV